MGVNLKVTVAKHWQRAGLWSAQTQLNLPCDSACAASLADHLKV